MLFSSCKDFSLSLSRRKHAMGGEMAQLTCTSTDQPARPPPPLPPSRGLFSFSSKDPQHVRTNDAMFLSFLRVMKKGGVSITRDDQHRIASLRGEGQHDERTGNVHRSLSPPDRSVVSWHMTARARAQSFALPEDVAQETQPRIVSGEEEKHGEMAKPNSEPTPISP
mmetsp:Transcript_12595/g.29217  ORF Transcript_12595/g.29217 Transcript_12595/m.29217 type:complete len:167 (-) Transcript_12595:1404-1904(-)